MRPISGVTETDFINNAGCGLVEKLPWNSSCAQSIEIRLLCEKTIAYCLASRIKKPNSQIAPRVNITLARYFHVVAMATNLLALYRAVHESQKGFLEGRYIGECVRMPYDVLQHTENKNIPGLLLMIDFKKAFDSVSCSFIQKSLIFFNFLPL